MALKDSLSRMLPTTLRLRLTTLVMLLVLGATVTVTVVALLLAERDMKAVIGNQQFALLSGAASHIDEHLASKKAMLAALAESLPAAAYADAARLHQFLALRPIARREFSSIEVYDARGTLVDTQSAAMPAQPFSVKDLPYFERTVKHKRGMVSAPFVSKIAGTPTVLITAPVLDERGQVVLVLAGGIDLLHYAPFEALSALKPGSTGFTFIMTGDGILLSHPDKSRILRNIRARPGRNLATEAALGGFEGWAEAENKDGVKGIYSYRRLTQTDWIVAARYPTDEALAPLRQMRYEASAAAAIFALAAGLLAWLGIARLMRPLQRLRRNITEIKNSRAGIQLLQLDRKDEIGELSGAFYRLVSEREKAQARTRNIADNLPVLIAYLDKDKRYQFTNQHYQVQWGMDPQQMLGRSVEELFGDSSASWQGDLDRTLAGERLHYERALDFRGVRQHYLVDLIPDADDQGRIQGMYLMATDITARKDAELRQAASEQRAEAASRAKSEFVANMSHEIRTPMNAVLGVAYLLGNTDLNAAQKKYLDMILASGNALLGILNDVLDFSKIEAGRMELAPVGFQLNDVLNAISTVMTLNAGDKPLELAIGVDPAVPHALVGDAMRLQQVLINLVGNAVKFTEKGEVSLLVELAPDAAPGPVMLRFVVRDTGIGMDFEQQSRLFSAFSQADASTTRRFGGTGLGLAICRRLVELMGGSIAVRSAPGIGSEFVATVPFQRGPEAHNGSGGGGVTGNGNGAAALGRLHLLVVDDNETSRDYLCRTIRSWNWQADAVASGAQAVEQLLRRQLAGVRYDAVLVDWQMPGMDGIAAMQALRDALSRAQPDTGLPADPPATLPVALMVSASGREALMRQPGAALANAVLIKPATSSGLFDTLHEALAQRAADQGAALSDVPDANAMLQNLRLLLVEDHPLNQLVARGMLEYAGAAVEVAENGQIAVDLLRARPDAYDIVLMDVQMPVLDGFAATRVIREELKLSIPILAMTAGVMQSEQEQCIAAGMDDFIAKPVDVEQMLTTIMRHAPAQRRSLHWESET
jgi:PAS domain S-box-containing protein